MNYNTYLQLLTAMRLAVMVVASVLLSLLEVYIYVST